MLKNLGREDKTMNNDLLANLQEALNAANVQQEQTDNATTQQESSFVDEIVPLQSASKETQYSGK